jgi:hypothetical protein
LKPARSAKDQAVGTEPGVDGPAIRHRGRALVEFRRERDLRARRLAAARRHREYRRLLRREREEFGRQIQWEAVFFGLLAAVGLAATLVAMYLGALAAAGVTSFGDDAKSFVGHLGAGEGAVAIAILALGYLTGGYVAARMARFDGWRQGLGIWLLSLLIVLAAAVTAWIAGAELNPSDSISLPANPIDQGPLSQSWWVIAVVAVVVPLVFAIIGGVLGERFHRAVDRVGYVGPEEPDVDPDSETEILPRDESGSTARAAQA